MGAAAWDRDAQAYPPGGLDVFARMQRDAQVRACLTTKRLAVLSERAEVHPADDTAVARRAAATAQGQLATLPGGIPGIVSGALDALAMGYAIGELVWSDSYDLTAVRWHDPRRFQFETGDDGAAVALLLIDHSLTFPADRFLIFSYGSRYGNPYGESDLTAAYRAWVSKDQLRRMWLSALDRFGAPIPVAKVPVNWRQDQIDGLSRTLSRLQNESSLIVPDDVEIAISLDSIARGTGAGVRDGD